ncbi:MAG: hypothetical protein R3C46_03625 [Hyphomonadaceae bacterium]
MRNRLGIAMAALALLAAACEAPADGENEPAAELPVDPNTFRAGSDPAYAGEWASETELCANTREIWTIETRRLGMKRQRFCIFDPMLQSTTDEGQGWSASARCVSDGRESRDFLFFRIQPNMSQMRVTFNDQRSVELVRCPTRT